MGLRKGGGGCLRGVGWGVRGQVGKQLELKGLRSPLPHQQPPKPLGEGGLVT